MLLEEKQFPFRLTLNIQRCFPENKITTKQQFDFKILVLLKLYLYTFLLAATQYN